MKVFSKLACVLAALLFIPACSDATTPEQYVEKAKALIENGSLPEARIELLNAARKNPGSAEVRVLLARVLYDSGDFASAEKEIEKSMELGAPKKETQPILVSTLFKQGRWEEVIEAADPLADNLSPENAGLVLALAGQSHISQVDHARSETLLKSAMEQDPGSAEARIGMAALRGIEGDLEEAMRWTTDATKVAPESADAWSATADLEMEAGNVDKAIAAYSKAIELRPYITLDRAKRANLLLGKKDFAGAEADIKALVNSPLREFWYVSHLRGVERFYQKDYQEAMNYFQDVENKNNSAVETWPYAAVAQSRLGNVEQALFYANKFVSALPNSTAPKNLLASLLYNKGDLSGAKVVLGQLIEAEPENIEVIKMLGMVNFYEGNYPEAEKYTNKMHELAPESEAARSMSTLLAILSGKELAEIPTDSKPGTSQEEQLLLAVADFQAGRIEAAREKAHMLLEADPGNMSALQIVAATYLAKSDWKQARTVLLEVQDRYPNEKMSLRNLAKLEIVEGNTDLARTYVDRLSELHHDDAQTVIFCHDTLLQLGDTAAAASTLALADTSQLDDADTLATLLDRQFYHSNYAAVLQVAGQLPAEQLNQSPLLLLKVAQSQAQTGKGTQAKKTFEHAIGLLPDSASARRSYARALVRMGEVDNAFSEYDKALAAEPGNLSLALEYINLLGELKRFEQANAVLAATQKLHPDSIVLGSTAGWLALLENNLPLAEKLLLESNVAAPSQKSTILLARAQAYQGKIEASEETLNAWIAKNPQDRDVLLNKAGLYLAEKRETDALQVYKTILSYFPNDIPSLNNAAWLARDIDRQFALKAAAHAYSLNASDPFVLDTYGKIKLMNGETKEGLALLLNAAELAPNDMQIQLHLAEAHVQSKENDRARVVLQKILKTAPETDLAAQASEIMANL